ncbi:P27 family phage terminase small subunit [Clostridium gasigenes]|uniref:P27 family phage terminase small subunit n=1 Tax=Clostridium gasigenes TaxID=94869 RepID=UPI00162335BE|nr:P27 family phage terminase small subunit [Clostridium gasigenes]MBB6622560.1 P27 family phage terminase small subunit [Clostridium gasigenes]
MARPCKAAGVLTDKSQTKDEIKGRIENEEKLKGKSDKINAPEQLTSNQEFIFNFIVDELEESKLLGNLDIFILISTCIAIDRRLEIEWKINKNPSLLFRKEVISTRKSYSEDFFRGCNELSLSPQSRAKLANLNLMADKDKEDPLLIAIRNRGKKGG